MQIAVADIGYVGLANAALLTQQHEVVAFDIDADRISTKCDGLIRAAGLTTFFSIKKHAYSGRLK